MLRQSEKGKRDIESERLRERKRYGKEREK